MTDHAATQLDMRQKLLEIFRPYATKTRVEMAQRGARFVHYTSADNALNISTRKRSGCETPTA
jgi:hypothetical protein